MFKLFANHKRTRHDFYDYSVSPPMNNGAEHCGFIKKFANPLLVATGTGYIPARSISPMQPPQVFAYPQSTLSGNGVNAGNIIKFSPLLNTDMSTISD